MSGTVRRKVSAKESQSIVTFFRNVTILLFPSEFRVNDNSKVFCGGGFLNGDVVNLVGRNEGLVFVGDSQGLALAGVKLHFPFLFPILKGVQVFLKGFRIVGRFDGSVKEGIVGEKSNLCYGG